jgi:uncharacterized protein YgbK (DUF1537 family)
MSRLLIVADDFTGALDTGVQFSKKGVPALVLTKEQTPFGGPRYADVEVLVVDTESRHLPPSEAYEIVGKVTRDAARSGVRHFYKKTDSALRGNIGAELAGMLDAGGENCLSFVPAFPKSHRVTQNGIQYIDGVELARSVFSKDPFTPVRHSSVADIIHMQTDIPTENIASDSYERAGVRPDRKTLRIFDAGSMDDIRRLGAQLKRGDNMRFLAGCAGFAEILPELLELPARSVTCRQNADNVLVVSGSVNPITIEQTARGEEFGFRAFTLSSTQKLDASYPGSEECCAFVRNVADELKCGGRVILRTVREQSEVAGSELYASENGIPENEISRRVADNIGEITVRILNSVHVGNLVVFGGDTLHSVLSKMRCDGVFPVFEISPGVVVAKILSAVHTCVIITKSGGLGNRDVLESITGFVWRRI